jgi:hypothetical protein
VTKSEDKLLSKMFDVLVSASDAYEYEIERAVQAYARRQAAGKLALSFARQVNAPADVQRTIEAMASDGVLN